MLHVCWASNQATSPFTKYDKRYQILNNHCTKNLLNEHVKDWTWKGKSLIWTVLGVQNANRTLICSTARYEIDVFSQTPAACVCVCVYERERERERACGSGCVGVGWYVSVLFPLKLNFKEYYFNALSLSLSLSFSLSLSLTHTHTICGILYSIFLNFL